MKVYIVTKTWVNYDGWPISNSSIESVFINRDKAMLFSESLKTGNLDGNHYTSYVREMEAFDGDA